MQVLTVEELRARKVLYCRKILQDVFIYPTDTIYGIGCDATNGALVHKVRELKGRQEMPLSVIAPSKEWIHEVCEVDKQAQEWLDKLPGPYTLVLKIKDEHALPFAVTCGKDSLGVRMPKHWITDCVAALKKPIITTSANIHGRNHMRDTEDIPSAWKSEVAFVIYEGDTKNRPSTIIDLTKKEPRIQER